MNPATAATDVTGLVQGVYQFQLQVTDNNGATATDIIRITVNVAVNIPPVADAGPDRVIALPTNFVTLLGSGSDVDGTIVGYAWTKISGPVSYTIVNPTAAATDITGLVQGVYQFQLQVTDNSGAVGIDIVRVTVNSAANIPPVANAGPDLTITLPVDSATLSGNGIDADGTVTGYQWAKISGPSSYNIVNPASPATDINGLISGVYVFELRVTDNNGARGRDTMQITVNSGGNKSPVANAGLDQTITLPTNSATLSGSGSDADGTIVGYSWKVVSGPSGSVIVSSDSAVTLLNELVGGTYQLELTVTDNLGATGKDTVSIVVAEPRLNLNGQNNALKIYPNPVVDVTTVEINMAQVNSKLGIVITNMQGKIVYRKEIAPGQNQILEKINMSTLAKGTYAITVYFDNNETQTKKVIKL